MVPGEQDTHEAGEMLNHASHLKREERKRMVKEAIREVVEEERMESFLKSIPPLSEREGKDSQKIW